MAYIVAVCPQYGAGISGMLANTTKAAAVMAHLTLEGEDGRPSTPRARPVNVCPICVTVHTTSSVWGFSSYRVTHRARLPYRCLQARSFENRDVTLAVIKHLPNPLIPQAYSTLS